MTIKNKQHLKACDQRGKNKRPWFDKTATAKPLRPIAREHVTNSKPDWNLQQVNTTNKQVNNSKKHQTNKNTDPPPLPLQI